MPGCTLVCTRLRGSVSPRARLGDAVAHLDRRARLERGPEIHRAGLTVVDTLEVPAVAWHVEATAWTVYPHVTEDRRADAHRARAEAQILELADSFAPDEPLRETFLAAAPVRQILEA